MVHGLAEAFADLGHEVVVLAPGPADEDESAFPYRVIRDPRIYPLRGGRLTRLAQARRTDRWIYEIVEDLKPNAMMLGVYKNYATASLRVGKHFDVPVGGLVHGLDVASVLDRRRSGLLRRIAETFGYRSLRKQVLAYLRQTDRLFANSSVTAAYVERACGRKPVIIGCGVPGSALLAMRDAKTAKAARPGVRARLALQQAPTIGFLGRLVARKNVESILQSLRELPNCRALVVGDGPVRSSLQQLAGVLGVDGRVTFVGQVDEESKWDYLRAMDVFCLPSTELGGYNFEGFGIAFLEATVAGVPVVGGRSGGIPDVIKNEETGLLADPGDWRDVTRCVRRMLEDERLASCCVSAAQDQVRNRFNWPAIARQLIDELDAASVAAYGASSGQCNS